MLNPNITGYVLTLVPRRNRRKGTELVLHVYDVHAECLSRLSR